ncbi:Septal ring factor EnvC, activator of murein hydrolases AmiA and AmiB [Desulfopila aestuarii DSM 18488]|uniref:Septal ring factor EnvC, activator of murein hydrolases AmiA and AmiB n=2 Tax=Desulfopila aestuarii TaxID=231440 RepID=A0A1M7Y1D5_9BACT|nr:Septal ring factor EnvC, activator of murein hydrolases AmiA and AmiB [Desulfopila aestuarii DSM 18488]
MTSGNMEGSSIQLTASDNFLPGTGCFWPQSLPALKHLFAGVFVYLIFTIVFCPIIASAAATKDIPGDIDSYREQIRRLERNIQEQKEKREETKKSEVNLLGELEDIDKRVKDQQKTVEDFETKVQLQQMLIDLKQEEIQSLQNGRAKMLDHLRKRSGAYYKMGKIGFLNVAFSSQTLPALLKFHDAFQTLITYDKNLIIEYRGKIQTLQRARDAENLELQLLQDFINEAQAERDKIDKIRSEKEQLLAHIRSQKQLHEQAAKEMEVASEELSQKLISLKSKEQILEKTFANSKGRLRVPVAGRVITYFHQEKFNRLGVLNKSQGIAIAAPDGTKVEAVSGGSVIFAGYLRGYGNTVIIHHGYQYYSITSRLEGIPVKEGDIVREGTKIGQVSETAALIDEGVYFEIRHGRDSQDPLKWLNLNKLEHSKHLQELNQG